MNPILRNILATIAGLVLGSVVNMAIISVSGSIIPPPQGADVTTLEGLKASIHLFKPINFLMPFLAHALGTLTGAGIAAKLATGRRAIPAYVVGAFFLAGGIANAFMLPAPAWFLFVDLGLAYIPAAWLGLKITSGK
ncbi:MAG: hypothetical protein JNL57_11470 [Bacteroidetes bacterium]|nr:hypothetical protein [Bacteroidota bacterium]